MTCKTTQFRQRGVILIVVLWVLALLMLLLGAFSTSVRVDKQIASEIRQRVQARAGADAALAYLAAMHRLGGDTWAALPGEVLILPLESGRVRFRLLPEEAYLSLTGASEELLRLLITALASERTDIELALASLLERRQPGATAQVDAAESEVPREPLRSVEELLLLPGFDRQLVERLAPLVTVDSNHSGVALRYAPSALLRVVTGGDERMVTMLRTTADVDLSAAGVNPAFVTRPGGQVFRLQVELGEGRQRRRTEVTVLFSGGAEDYQSVRWNEYNPRFSLD